LRKELESPNPDVTLYRDYAGCDVVLNPASPQVDWVREQLEDESGSAPSPLPSSLSQSARTAPDWSALADLSGSEHATSHVTDHFEEEDETQDGEEQLQDATDDTWSDTPVAQTDESPALEANAAGETDANMAMTTPIPQQNVSARETPHCIYCDSQLPASRNLRFCPYCGADQSTVPCATCGEALKPGWAFCIACGTAVA
jgi:hypothetical protein